MRPDLTVDFARERWSYDESTGHLTWLISPARNVKAGDLAGSVRHDSGYLFVRCLGNDYSGHRLIWLLKTGSWPSGHIDHINGCRADNHWTNLRDVTPAMNIQNQRRAHKRNKTGLLGVIPNKFSFSAQIRANGVRTRLGTFKTAEAAHEAYIKAKRELHAGFIS